MRALGNLMLFDFKMLSREFSAMFFMLLFPMLMLFLFGSIYGNTPIPEFGGMGTVDRMVPAFIAMIISVSGIMALPLTLCEYRDQHVLKRYRATPLRSAAIILSQLTINLVMTTLSVLLLIGVATLVYDIRMPVNLLGTAFMFLVSCLSIFTIGFLIAAVSPSGKAANTIALLVYFPCIFLTGATMPLEFLPQLMQDISLVLPVTHAVNGMVGVWGGASAASLWIELTVLGSFFVVLGLLSLKLFKWE
jgi:ABC-2 type transport system permease protein